MDLAGDCLYIADDITGAGDVGVQLRKFFDDVYICTGLREFNENFPVIFDSETRNVNPEKYEEIYANIKESIKTKKILYKKIDSTLRGNIRSELNYFSKIRNNCPIFFIPAFPEMGRCIKNGILMVNDVPLSQTEYMNISMIKPLSERISDYCPDDYSFYYIKESDFDLYDNLSNCFFSFECTTTEDLEKISDIIYKIASKTDIILASSAGIAGFLPQSAGLSRKTKSNDIIPLQTYFICGSINSINMSLVKDSDMEIIILENERFIRDNDYFESVKHDIVKKLLFGKNVALFSQREITDTDSVKFESKIIELFRKTYSLSPRIVISGGSTAYSCIRGIDKYFFKIDNVADTGIPLINIDDREFVIKPGGFGNNRFFINLTEEVS